MYGVGTILLWYGASAGAVLVLFLVALWQSSRVRTLEKELDQITLKYQQQSAAPRTVREELFEHCPYPIVIADTKGKILAGNESFLQLAKTPVRTLSEFDAVTHTELRQLQTQGRHHTHRLLTLSRKDQQVLRQFHVVAWPIWGPHAQSGTVYTFHEQTHVLRRKRQQLHFEQQLVGYLAYITVRLEELLHEPGKSASREKLLTAYSSEMRMLTAYLQQIHTQVRQPNPHASLDVAKLCKEVLEEEKERVRRQKIHLFSGFSGKPLVICHHTDAHLALSTLVSAILEQLPANSELRLTTKAAGKRLALEITVPGLVLSEQDQQRAFAFGLHEQGISENTRLWRLKLAITQEIVSKYNAHLSLISHESFGTTYRVSFLAAKTP